MYIHANPHWEGAVGPSVPSARAGIGSMLDVCF